MYSFIMRTQVLQMLFTQHFLSVYIHKYAVCLLPAAFCFMELHALCFMISARSSLSIFDSPTITYANLSYSSHGSSWLWLPLWITLAMGSIRYYRRRMKPICCQHLCATFATGYKYKYKVEIEIEN